MRPVEDADFFEYVIKVPCFLAEIVPVSVAVHRIATPNYLETFSHNSSNERRQAILDLIRAKPGDDGETPRFIVRIKPGNELLYVINIIVGTDFKSDRITNTAEEFHMAPSTWRVRSPIQSIWALQSYQSP